MEYIRQCSAYKNTIRIFEVIFQVVILENLNIAYVYSIVRRFNRLSFMLSKLSIRVQNRIEIIGSVKVLSNHYLTRLKLSGETG
jgi:hypothetical protein